MPKTKTPKSQPPSEKRIDQIALLNGRYVSASEMIKFPPINHPRGKDGGSGR